MPRGTPDPRQKTLRLSFSARKQAMRAVQVGNPIAKSLLCLIECHVGDNPAGFRLRTEDLAWEANCGVTTAEKWIDALESDGFIRREPINRRYQTYFMCWGRVFGQVEGTAEVCDDVPPGGEAFHHVESGSTTWNETPPRGEKLHVVESYIEERNLSANLAQSSAPPSALATADDEGGDRMESQKAPEETPERLLTALRECGVGEIGRALELARGQGGQTLQQIAGVVEFFRLHPGRYPPQVLYHRLTRPGAGLQGPAEGWFGESKGWAAQQQHKAALARQAAATTANESDREGESEMGYRPGRETQLLEKQFGEQLDAMTKDELLELLGEGHVLQRVIRKHGAGSNLARPVLLAKLQARLQPVQKQEEMF